LNLLGFGRVELEGEVDAVLLLLLPLLPLDNKEEDGDEGEDGGRLPPSLTSSEGEFHDQVDNAQN
jgi:hypothetical protein